MTLLTPQNRLAAARAAPMALVGLLFAGVPALCQDGAVDTPTQRTAAFSDQISVEWVSVAAVVEARDRPVPELEPGLFELFVDGRPVPIAEFEGDGEIVHLLYLQDVSGSMALRRRLAISRAVYRRMVGQLMPGDKLALATFASQQARLVRDFTDDASQLEGLAESWKGYGETALLDAAARIPELTRSQWARTSALLVTDGVDNASRVPLEEIRTLLSSSGIPVYVFGLEGGAGPLATAPSATGDEERPMDAYATEEELADLRELARASGGRYVNLTTTSVELAVSRILRDIRRRVFVSFPTRSDTPRSMHTLEVRVPTRAGVVHHRTHYFGHEPRAWSEN